MQNWNINAFLQFKIRNIKTIICYFFPSCKVIILRINYHNLQEELFYDILMWEHIQSPHVIKLILYHNHINIILYLNYKSFELRCGEKLSSGDSESDVTISATTHRQLVWYFLMIFRLKTMSWTML